MKNPNFPPNTNEFEKLSYLGFEQTDDYFGIKNNTDSGDNVKLWLFPLISGKEVNHSEGPYDAIRITYVVVRNDPRTADLFEKTFDAITSSLNVTPQFEGKQVHNYSDIKQTIEYPGITNLTTFNASFE